MRDAGDHDRVQEAEERTKKKPEAPLQLSAPADGDSPMGEPSPDGGSSSSALAPASGTEQSASSENKRQRVQREVQHLLLSLGATSSVDVAELFCPGRFTDEAKTFGLIPGTAFDLRTGWDADDPQQVRKLWLTLEQERPRLIIGSPKCTPFQRPAVHERHDFR